MIRLLFVVIGALIVTALGIDAADTFGGSRTTFLASLMYTANEVVCGPGMSEVVTSGESFCIDTYEVSTGAGCVVDNPTSLQGTANNIAEADCLPVSKEGVLPWRFVTYDQARQLCARNGKMLPSAVMWYEAALGTPDNSKTCVLADTLQITGSESTCISGHGAYDMIGNVWEYIETPTGADLPDSGYVAMVDESGMPIEVASSPKLEYASDYVWTTEKKPFVVVRGGFYAAKEDGGLYSVQGTITPDFSSAAIGFRCARAL